MKFSFFLKFLVLLFLTNHTYAQNITYSHSDSIKGSITKERLWWDALHYELHISFNVNDSTINGFNKVTYKVLKSSNIMQLDLMAPLIIDSILQDNKRCKYVRDGDAYFLELNHSQIINDLKTVFIYYHGKPRRAKHAPWDGGVIWSKDSNSNPWVSVACQGLAASVWFPCKDHQSDEADSVSMFITVPKELIGISNGQLRSVIVNDNKTITYNWAVTNPINNYNVTTYIGKYINFKDTFNGKGGILNLDFWVLDGNLEKAKNHFTQVKPMLRCFESWFGKYPFYKDGYKLVQSPFLGMEHQSAIAYGNNFLNGYMGQDLSLTGWGLKWDFIIIHESGHEWFGNNISVKDVADNWVHEGFTAYAENLYTEFLFGKNAGAAYVIGTRTQVENDVPIISDYNVNRDGSGDKYYKAANMLHTIRTIVDNDSIWKFFLQDINKTFWHQTVTTKQIEDYMINYLKKDLQKIFDQYLRTIKIPELEYYLKRGKLFYRWTNCVPGFNMPLKINDGNSYSWLQPKEEWQKINYSKYVFMPDTNFYISSQRLIKKQ